MGNVTGAVFVIKDVGNDEVEFVKLASSPTDSYIDRYGALEKIAKCVYQFSKPENPIIEKDVVGFSLALSNADKTTVEFRVAEVIVAVQRVANRTAFLKGFTFLRDEVLITEGDEIKAITDWEAMYTSYQGVLSGSSKE